MKTILAAVLLVLFSGAPARAQEEADIGMFYSSLGAQGQWISVDGQTYAWKPDGVGPDWRPYSDGHWVWTDDGWYWASDEPWAWATYHYGRWYCDDYYGWVWVPGYEWAPAWVEWRYGGSCVGWAPLSPYAVFSASWGVHYRRYWATPYYYWSFVDCRYMGAGDLRRHVYRSDENTRFISRTRTAGSVRYDNGRIMSRGPEREFVEQRGNVRIPRAALVDVKDRGRTGMVRDAGGERIEVYRPRIDAASRAAIVTRPDRIRADDHPMGFDTRGTDIRRIDDARQRGGTGLPTVRQAEPNSGRERPSVRQPVPERIAPRPVARPESQVRPPERPVAVPRTSRPERVPEVRNRPGFNTPRGGNWSTPRRTAAPAGRSEPSRGERSGGGGRGGRR